MEQLRVIRVEGDPDRLAQMACRLHRPELIADMDYLVHEALAFTAGKGEYGKEIAALGLPGFDYPKPFWIKRNGGAMAVYGYARTPLSVMRRHATAMADAPAAGCLDWGGAVERVLPTVWEVGRRVGFRCTAAVTVLWTPAVSGDEDPLAHAAGDTVGVKRPRAHEIDAYTYWLKTNGAGAAQTPRSVVYRQWFERQTSRLSCAGARDASTGQWRAHGPPGAASVRVEVAETTTARVLRCEQGPDRRAVRVGVPVAAFSGVLEVRDSAGFERLLLRGIGRQTAFGLGMLRLFPI